MIGIYKITSPTGRIYIGQSVNIEHRWKEYKRLECKSQTKLFRSFLKYGVENHLFEVLIECCESELNELERYYQELNNVLLNGLNCFYTKSDSRSGKMCDSVKKKIGDAQRGEKNHMYGKKASEETRRKLSESRKGRVVSAETIEKVRQAHIGRKASAETRRKQSEAKKGFTPWNKGKKVMSDEQKEHLRKINIGKCTGEENYNSKPVVNIVTGEVFVNAKIVADKLNVKSSTFRSWLNGRRKNNTDYQWMDC